MSSFMEDVDRTEWGTTYATAVSRHARPSSAPLGALGVLGGAAGLGGTGVRFGIEGLLIAFHGT